MVYTDANAEIIGVIFLYHIFNEIGELEEKKIKETDLIINEQEPNSNIEMDNLRSHLLNN